MKSVLCKFVIFFFSILNADIKLYLGVLILFWSNLNLAF